MLQRPLITLQKIVFRWTRKTDKNPEFDKKEAFLAFQRRRCDTVLSTPKTHSSTIRLSLTFLKTSNSEVFVHFSIKQPEA